MVPRRVAGREHGGQSDEADAAVERVCYNDGASQRVCGDAHRKRKLCRAARAIGKEGAALGVCADAVAGKRADNTKRRHKPDVVAVRFAHDQDTSRWDEGETERASEARSGARAVSIAVGVAARESRAGARRRNEVERRRVRSNFEGGNDAGRRIHGDSYRAGAANERRRDAAGVRYEANAGVATF